MAVWAAETCRRVPHIKTISLVYILVLLLYYICSINARMIDHPKVCISLSLRLPNDYCSYSSWITVNVGSIAAPDWSLGLHILDHFASSLRQYCASCLCVWSGLVYTDLCVETLVVSDYQQMYKCHHINRTWNVKVVHNSLPQVTILTRHSETATLFEDKFWKPYIFALVFSIPHRVTPDGMLFREISEKIG